jgi:hypothetical protein
MAVATTVIIPARNEESTIGAIIRVFNEHPETKYRVFVGIDAATIDNTPQMVWENDAIPIDTAERGKGQVVSACLDPIRAVGQMTDRVILCDADYTGLTLNHITRILMCYKHRNYGMTVGVPDFPEIDVPERVINSWPRVSGFRYLPSDLIPKNGHGYLLETQLNIEAIKRRLPIPFVMMPGLKSPFQWPLSPERMRESERDRRWGRLNGVL